MLAANTVNTLTLIQKKSIETKHENRQKQIETYKHTKITNELICS